DFNADFRVTAETVNGLAVAFGYDADGLATCVGGDAACSSTSSGVRIDRYAGTTLLHTVTGPIGATGAVTESYTPSGFGETQDYVVQVGSATLLSEHYERDTLGRITQRTESIVGATGALGPSETLVYTYDAERLSDVEGPGHAVHYDYDANGNRL